MNIIYKVGDATSPEGDGPIVIAHICNNVGAWGAGFVLALSKKWAEPEHTYHNYQPRDLGTTMFIPVEDNINVANMIAQDNIITKH